MYIVIFRHTFRWVTSLRTTSRRCMFLCHSKVIRVMCNVLDYRTTRRVIFTLYINMLTVSSDVSILQGASVSRYQAFHELTVTHPSHLRGNFPYSFRTVVRGLNRRHPARQAASSETQGQSVRSGEKAERKFSSTGERAPGHRLLPYYFQKLKRTPVPDWAQKMLCIIVPNRRTVSPELFS